MPAILVSDVRAATNGGLTLAAINKVVEGQAQVLEQLVLVVEELRALTDRPSGTLFSPMYVVVEDPPP